MRLGGSPFEESLALTARFKPPPKDNLTVSTVGSYEASVETFLDHPHIFITLAYGSLCSLQF